MEREEVVRELARNGKNYVKIDGGGTRLAVREDDVRGFADGFKVDKVRSQLFIRFILFVLFVAFFRV
jgi:hypothetical protein